MIETTSWVRQLTDANLVDLSRCEGTHVTKRNTKQRIAVFAQRRRLSFAYYYCNECTALAIYWTALEPWAAKARQAMRRHIEELLKLSHESGKVRRRSANFSSRSLPWNTPETMFFFFNSLKKHNIYGVFHHLWRCFTTYDDLVGGSRSLAPSKFCGRTWRAVIIWWRTGSPESVLWKWFFVVHQLKSNHPDISWL